MPLDGTSKPSPDTITTLLGLLQDALRTQFGTDVDITAASALQKILEAFGSLPVAEAQMDLLDAFLQTFPGTAIGSNLDGALFIGTRRQASYATGTVVLTLNTALASSATPLFTSGSLVFFDAAGNSYRSTADVVPNGTTSLNVPVQADVAQAAGNVAISGIVDKAFTTSAAQSNFATYVTTGGSFANTAAFFGGQDKESDTAFLSRFRGQLAAKPQSTPQGIAYALFPDTTGVLSADVVENTDPQLGTADDSSYFDNSAHTGTGSETIDAVTKTRIAQKVVVASGTKRWLQDFSAKMKTNSSVVFTARVETDTAGSPSGTLYNANLALTGFTPATTTRTTGHFAEGAFIDATSGAVTVWLVLTATSGTCTVDGDAVGTALTKYYDGSWHASALNNLDVQLIVGVPPNSFRAYVQGGAANDIAAAILGAKPLGIYSDGNSTGTTKDPAGNTVTVRYDTPTLVDVYVNLTVNATSGFSGTATSLKDTIIDFIGGTDSGGISQGGLATSATLYYNQLMAAILNASDSAGIQTVTVLQIGITPSPTGVVDLTLLRGKKFRVQASNIAVTINSV